MAPRKQASPSTKPGAKSGAKKNASRPPAKAGGPEATPGVLSFSQKLEMLRARSGARNADIVEGLAKHGISISDSTISRWIKDRGRGRWAPRMNQAIALAKFFGTTVESMNDGTDEIVKADDPARPEDQPLLTEEEKHLIYIIRLMGATKAAERLLSANSTATTWEQASARRDPQGPHEK